MLAVRQRFIVVALCLGLFAFYAANSRPALAADPVFVGAGDIADCTSTSAASSGAEQTARLLDTIDGTVFTLGDNAYDAGTATQFSTCYDPTWGRHKARTRPVPGNHDYDTSGAAPYYSYFGANAGPAGQGYYSYNIGAWHIIALNSEIDASAVSAQAQWLRGDLAASSATCTLAYWHKPLFSSGQHGNLPNTQELWKILHQYGADVILNAHDHDYERFAPQDPYGAPDPNGIREFVVGTGGADQRGMAVPRPNSEKFDSSSFGVLKLALHDGSYDWQFVPVAGETFTDLGAGACYAGANPTATPTNTATPLPQGQSNFTFDAAADTYVDKATPTASYANNSQLLGVGGTNPKQIFLRFAVSGLPTDATILDAKLQLYVANASANSGGIFKTLSNTTWAESITWNTQPAIDGPQLASIGSVTAGQFVIVNVSSAIAGNGAYSFAITSPTSNGDTFGYTSFEGAIAENRPKLIITTQTGPLPTSTPTATATNTPTVTPTSTQTNTPTATPTASATNTATPTSTPTATPVSASTPTDTPTSTPTATPTASAAPTNTPTNTPSSTPTATPTSTPAPANLLLNGGFELDANVDGRPDSWTSNSRFTRSTTLVRSGVYSGKHFANNNANYTIAQQVNNLLAGSVYSFSGAVNIPATSDSFTFKLDVQWRNSSGSTLRTDVIKTYTRSTGGAWDQITTQLAAAPSGTSSAQIRMVVSSLNAAVYVDDFVFQANSGAAPTATPTPTATNTATPVSSPTSTPTATPTSTPMLGGATYTFGPVADTYVSQASPTASAGTSSSMSIVGGTTTEKQAFIRFTVSGLPDGALVQSAKLRLVVTNDSTGGGDFRSVSNTSWAESITWSTKPAIDGPLRASVGAVAIGAVVEVDLTGVIAGNGSYSFAITLPGSNGNTVGYAARENTTVANRPQLIITTQ